MCNVADELKPQIRFVPKLINHVDELGRKLSDDGGVVLGDEFVIGLSNGKEQELRQPQTRFIWRFRANAREAWDLRSGWDEQILCYEKLEKHLK